MTITRQLESPRCEGGESPLWDAVGQSLLYLDNVGRKVHRHDIGNGTTRTYGMPEPVTAIALRQQGGALVNLSAYSGGIRTGFRFYPDRVPAEVGQRSGVCRTGFREHPDSNPGSVGQSSGRIRTLFRGIRTALDHPGWGEFGGIG